MEGMFYNLQVRDSSVELKEVLEFSSNSIFGAGLKILDDLNPFLKLLNSLPANMLKPLPKFLYRNIP